MQAARVEVGRNYAVRRKVTDHEEEPFKARVLQLPGRQGRVQIQISDGLEAGMTEWVTTRQLLCPWAERKVYQRDQRRHDEVEAISREQYDYTLDSAIMYVLDATGDNTGSTSQKSATWVIGEAALGRLWARSRLGGEPQRQPPAFIDRHGDVHLPWSVALRFSEAFAAAEPEPVMTSIDDFELQLKMRRWSVAETFSSEFLRTQLPALAIVRQWCGAGATSRLEERIKVLERAVTRAVGELRRFNHQAEANGIERELGRHDWW